MSNVVQFMERLGRDPRCLSIADYAASVAALDIDEEQRRALLDRDHDALSGLLGGREKMMCVVWPADEPGQDDQPAREQPAEEQPAEDAPPETE